LSTASASSDRGAAIAEHAADASMKATTKPAVLPRAFMVLASSVPAAPACQSFGAASGR
jgi:hypothetical protein